jgi:hypothetical protein
VLNPLPRHLTGVALGGSGAANQIFSESRYINAGGSCQAALSAAPELSWTHAPSPEEMPAGAP